MKNKSKDTCAADFCHSLNYRHKHVYKATSSKLRECHCTLFKPLHSGIDVTAPKGRVTLLCLCNSNKYNI